MKDEFKKVTTRDKKAAAYFSSTEFLDVMKQAIEKALVNNGGDRAYISPNISVKQQDMPYIEKAFLRLKKEYPELDHVRLNAGFASRLGSATVLLGKSIGWIVVDTKKNTVRRRISDGWGNAW